MPKIKIYFEKAVKFLRFDKPADEKFEAIQAFPFLVVNE